MFRLGCVHHRLELIGLHGRGEILRAKAQSLELVESIGGGVDHNRRRIRAERAGVRHEMQSVVRLQT